MTDKKDKKNKNKKKGKLSSEDKALWDYVSKTVTPIENERPAIAIEGDATPPSTTKKNKNAGSAYEPADDDRFPQKKKAVPPKQKSRDLDGRTAQRLRRGQYDIEATIDLHGMTQEQAHRALIAFINKVHTQQKRCVLVITGKGNRKDGLPDPLVFKPGILRQKVPEWLNSTPLTEKILAIESARPQHGGHGAYYVLLRRIREDTKS